MKAEFRDRRRWACVVRHSREGSRHRYECECCGEVWRLDVASDYNYCPYCGLKMIEITEGE